MKKRNYFIQFSHNEMKLTLQVAIVSKLTNNMSHNCKAIVQMQGGHIFEQLNSLTFPEISRLFSNFSLSNSAENNSMKYMYISLAIMLNILYFPEFSRWRQTFSTKIQISLSFP